jgi:Flp pilus assembly protein TadG
MFGAVRGLLRSSSGAVAPTVALSLVGLIAVGGIAFDYARLASLDTELQDAADQAALAAAGQLDGQAGACARAAAAASSLLTNKTYFAKNTGSTTGTSVEVPTSGVSDCSGNASIQFYQSYNRDTDTPGPPADDDSNAKIVIVSVAPRQTTYFLTPIVAAFHSPDVGAQAVAALGSAVCKMPPVMICNPAETGGNTSFDPSDYVGDGLRLTSVGNGSGTWAPGNFGYLNTQSGVSGAPGLREALGWNSPPGECVSTDGVDTKPGATVTVTDAMNTRFDIYTNVSCPAGGTCSAAINSVKDVLRPANANGNNSCTMHNQGWQLPTNYYGSGNLPALNSTPGPLPAGSTPASMGHPRDECHAVSQNGSCAGGRIGDGVWDANAYFRTNYIRTVATANGAAGSRWTAANWQANTGLSPTAPRLVPGTTTPNPAYASRYNVYVWETEHRGQAVDGVTVLDPSPVGASGNTLVDYRKPVCSPLQGYGSGLVPNATTPDRRRVSVAVVNCLANSVKGNSVGVPVEKWVDVFITEPSLARERTTDGDMYVEIIGESVAGGSGSTAGQVIRHDVPYLIK